MSDASEKESPSESVEQQAAAWILRCDRGLTASEQDAFSDWLAAAPAHGAQLARHRRHWNRLNHLAQWRPEHGARPNPDLLAPPRHRPFFRFMPVTMALAAAAALVAGFIVWKQGSRPPGRPAEIATLTSAAGSYRTLEDGSVIELNRGAEVTVHFTPGERRVSLVRGEAHFTVTKNPARPFIVTAHGVDVRAVGTAFNVRVETAAVEVLVTEGRVQVNQPSLTGEHSTPVAPAGPLIPILGARQRAVISLLPATEPPQIATLTAGEVERVLAWQHRLLEFTAAPLAEIVAEFNRHNAVQLVLSDPELASVHISASFRSDNIEVFVHFLETGFSVQAERRGESEIVLRKAR